MKNPLSTAKDLYKLQKEAKEMQNKMQKVLISGESKNGEVKISINGAQELIDIEIEDYLLSPDQKKRLVEFFKDSYKDAQKKLQKELMKDMDMDKIKSLFS